MPVWQHLWDARGRDFRIVAVAQDVQGEERVRPLVVDRGITFPVLIDRSSQLARQLEFRIVPSGVFIDAEGVIRYRHTDDFDVGDPRVRVNLETFLSSGAIVEPPAVEGPMDPRALELFAVGAGHYRIGRSEDAVETWRRALDLDPDNFLIRSQIWAVEHPENFYPVVDRDWQSRQLLKEGYDKPLP